MLRVPVPWLPATNKLCAAGDSSHTAGHAIFDTSSSDGKSVEQLECAVYGKMCVCVTSVNMILFAIHSALKFDQQIVYITVTEWNGH